MSYDTYTNPIEKVLKKRGFDWDDYLFLLNNQTIYKTIEKLNSVEWLYEDSYGVPDVVYNKNNILNATFLEPKQIDFLIENKLIDEKEWTIVQPHEYWNLEFNNKTLYHFSKLQRLLKDIWSHYRLNEHYQQYDENNYLDFFKTNLKNIKITYTKVYFDRISVKKYEIIE